MVENRTICIDFYVDIRRYREIHDFPVQGAFTEEQLSKESTGPFNTLEDAQSWMETEKIKLTEQVFWKRGSNGDLFNEWKSYYQSFSIRQIETVLGREFVRTAR
jgi:hypothetical protein